jgi:hypothetical protein
VQHEFNFKYKHNDRLRVTAVCKEQDCTWRIHVSLDAKKEAMQIKTFVPNHQCGNQYETKRADVEFLVAKYTPDFKDDPTWTPYAL